MKKYYIIFTLFLGILSSCKMTQTFTVFGAPGTVISTKGIINSTQEQLAVIDQTGQAKIALERWGGFDHFLLAQAPGSNVQVPFALDYKNHNRESWGAIGVTSAGVLEIGGLITAVVGGVTNNKSISLIGVGIVLASLPFWATAKFSMRPNLFNYDYIKVQSTNNDLIR